MNDMKCEKVVFILDKVQKVNKTLTRAKKRKIQMAKAQRARETRKLV